MQFLDNSFDLYLNLNFLENFVFKAFYSVQSFLDTCSTLFAVFKNYDY